MAGIATLANQTYHYGDKVIHVAYEQARNFNI